MQKYHTIIIGGGQAGLSTSYYLMQHGIDHLVLDQAAQVGNAWRNDRWDSFTLLTPNWSFRLPGGEYKGDNPEGFMARKEIVTAIERYVEQHQLPVQLGVRVDSVKPLPDESGYLIRSNDTVYEARHVVIATGLFQRPKIPAFSAGISRHILQLHSGQYRNPQALPPGAVLVVGSAQSGCQIAEELYLSGRTVYLGVSSAGRVPRRYRGKDIYEWLHLSGFLDRSVDKLPSPKARFSPNPQLSGRGGGHNLNLHQFVRDGVILLGRIEDGRDGRIWLASNLKENLAKTDKFETDIVKLVDEYIARNGMEIPDESLPMLRDGYNVEESGEVDLLSAGINTIIWATGYAFDFKMVRLPVVDEFGYPIQKKGVTAYPGLYFVGLPWLTKQKSGLLLGVGEDAENLACVISTWG